MKKNFIPTAIIVFLFTFLFNSTGQSQIITQLSFYSPLISTFDMKYTNNHLVVSQNGLLIFDVTNPVQKPRLVAQTSYPGSVSYSIAVRGNYAYMGFGNNGIFAVYDISDFSKPVLKGTLAIPSLSFYVYGDVELHDDYAYLSGFDSLYVVNIADPTSPVLANAIPVAHTEFTGAEAMAVEGASLFVKTPLSIQAYDIANATEPSLISSIPYLHAYDSRLVADTVNHRLFVSWATALKDFTGYDGFDVSNPSSPAYLFSDSTAFSSGDFGIMDYSYFSNVLFVSKGGSVSAFDVSSSHHFVTTFSGEDIPNSSVSIQVRDSVFFHARGGGIEVLKYTNTPPPPVCVAPDGLYEHVAGTTVSLRWNKKPLAKGYLVRYRALGTNNWTYIPSIDNFAKITNLKSGKGYTWEVRSVCGKSLKETSDWSLYNIFFVNSSLITVSPNPVQTMMHVHVADASVKRIVIADVSGKPLIRATVSGADFNVATSTLTTGAYVVQALDNNNRVIALTKIFRQ